MVDLNHVYDHGSVHSFLLNPYGDLAMNSGKLPFVVFLNDKSLEAKINDLYTDHQEQCRKANGGKNTKGFHTTEYPFDKEWMITHDGPVMDDIYMSATLRRGRTKVFCGWLDDDGEEFFLVARTEAALKKFLQEFDYKNEMQCISKNEKVIQT